MKNKTGTKESLIGRRFTKGVVVSSEEKDKFGRRWRLKCDCGNEYVARTGQLTSKSTQSCGCLKKETPFHKYDYSGQKFNMLTAIKRVGKTRSGRYIWLCQCECGQMTEVSTPNLGNTKSCGCVRNYSGNQHHQWQGYGELSGRLWNRIKYNATKRDFVFDITIEEAWALFISQEARCAISNLPIGFGTKRNNITASLDRIDSSKGYTIDNVQWVHKNINQMKSNMSQEFFIDLCRKIVEHNKDK